MTGTHFGGLPGPGPILASCFVVSCTSTTTRLNLCNVSLCTNAKRFSRKTDLFLCLHPLGQKDRTQIQRFCVFLEFGHSLRYLWHPTGHCHYFPDTNPKMLCPNSNRKRINSFFVLSVHILRPPYGCNQGCTQYYCYCIVRLRFFNTIYCYC